MLSVETITSSKAVSNICSFILWSGKPKEGVSQRLGHREMWNVHFRKTS